jgi:hypothetical protein
VKRAIYERDAWHIERKRREICDENDRERERDGGIRREEANILLLHSVQVKKTSRNPYSDIVSSASIWTCGFIWTQESRRVV